MPIESFRPGNGYLSSKTQIAQAWRRKSEFYTLIFLDEKGNKRQRHYVSKHNRDMRMLEKRQIGIRCVAEKFTHYDLENWLVNNL